MLLPTSLVGSYPQPVWLIDRERLSKQVPRVRVDDLWLVDKQKLDPTRFGVEFGAGLIPSELDELAMASHLSTEANAHDADVRLWGEKGLGNIPPLWMLKYLPNMPACHVSILHNAQGPNNSITESDVAGLLALGEAMRILRREQADFFLVGGADSKINPLSMVRQCMFGHLSTHNEPAVNASAAGPSPTCTRASLRPDAGSNFSTVALL